MEQLSKRKENPMTIDSISTSKLCIPNGMKGGRVNGGGIAGRWPLASGANRASFAAACWGIFGIGKGKVKGW